MDKILVHDLPEDFETLELYPLLDLHIGDTRTDIALFKRFLEFIRAKPNRFLTIQGDLMNNATKGSVSNVYEDRMNPQEQKKFLIHELRYVKDRILCIVPGNHEERSTKESDNHPLEDLAIALDLEHLYKHDGAFVKVTFGKKINQKRVAYNICCVHGSGGGAKSGGAVNRMEDFLYSLEGVDILIAGHVHKKIAGKPSRLCFDPYNNIIRQRDMLWVIASPWQDFGGYSMRGMMRPSPKGKTPIIMYGTYKDFEATI